MPERTTYEIVLRGRPSDRLLQPLADDFAIVARYDDELTHLVGDVADPAHLHGLVAHLTSVNLEIVSIAPFTSRKAPAMTTTSDLTVAPEAGTTTETGQMQAVVQERYGSTDVLELRTIDRPTPTENEVLIEVVAAAVDRGTCHLMSGTPYLMRVAGFGVFKPKNKGVGLDVAGRIVAIGSGVTRFEVGDEVFGVGRGSLAEFAVAAEDHLTLKPANVSFEQAAASAVSGITALEALADIGNVQAGQRVLIVGASGGVGSFAVQLAKALGAHVTGVASTRNIDLLLSLGADRAIDYTTTDFAEGEDRYDLVVDIGGRNSVSRLRSVLERNGTLVIVGGEGGNRITGGIGRQIGAVVLSPFVSQRLTMFISTVHHSLISRLASHIESGAVTPAVTATFGLDEAADAIALLDAGKARGKTVISIRPAS
jgi:NADPH:quinone reductase-like Zn-dependent oxidoreductase